MKSIKVCDTCSAVYGIDEGSWRDDCGTARFTREGTVFPCRGKLDEFTLALQPGAILLKEVER